MIPVHLKQLLGEKSGLPDNYKTKNISENLKRLENSVSKLRPEIGLALNKDFAKPLFETDLTEVLIVLQELRNTRKNLRKWIKVQNYKRSVVQYNSSVQVFFQPKGVVLIISPWNYPFGLCMGPLVSALAAGNRVVLKPSEYTPNTNKIISKVLEDAKLTDLVTLVEGGADVAAELTSMPFNHIFFTGSPNIGKKVMEAASKNLASVTLELGGKSPLVISPTADLDKTVKRTVWGKFTNSGQTCIAPDYILAHSSHRKDLPRLLEMQIQHMWPKASAGDSSDPEYARIINRTHFERVSGLIDDAVEKGAEIICGGYTVPARNFISPTVLTGVNDDMSVTTEEIFGPVLPVIYYSDRQESISYINKRPQPLTAYIFTREKDDIRALEKSVPTGSLVINDVLSQFAHKNLPFGGVNQSGVGRAHGYAGFLEFSNAVSRLKTGAGPTAAEILAPPYTDFKRKLLNLAIKYLP